ncbi:MAG: trehalose-6-phosphate synthase, partial [Chloroflexota bacterium]|nr:trehalose-6-phosphate synthase [Chloroflexota bacterium]
DEAGVAHRIRFVAPEPTAYDRYYNTIANPLLWFLQHYLWDLAESPAIDAEGWRAWDEGYAAVNRLFAEAIVAAAGGVRGTDARPPLVMLHDYHLYLCAGLVRERLPGATITHFVHIPWPAPQYWRVLPGAWRRAICAGLLGADVVGFQTLGDARRFVDTCAAELPGATGDDDGRAVEWGGRRVAVRAYPIGIDTAAVRATAASPAAAAHLDDIRPRGDERLIVRTDRTEPIKNILRGFAAYRELLRQRPEWRGRVRFLALLSPSRGAIPQYAAYTERIGALASEIAWEFGTADWRPLQLYFTDDYPRTLAALRSYDVLLVNSLFDGMNLVAKEGPLVNERDGVLILSEGAGAFEQLGADALAVAPCDVAGTAAALHAALTMPPEERARRAAALRAAVERDDIVAWLGAQLADIEAIERRATSDERRMANGE